MYKNLLILGPNKCGKTTLSGLISNKYDCNIINIDNIIESYNKTFPRNEEYENNLNNFLINYLNQLSDYKNFYYCKKNVIEGNISNIDNIIENIDLDKLSIIGLSYNNINIDDFIQNIKNSEITNYLQFLSENSLKNTLNEYIEESKKMSEIFDNHGIINYDISNNRNEVFDTILDDVEKYTQYGSTYKVKKLK